MGAHHQMDMVGSCPGGALPRWEHCLEGLCPGGGGRPALNRKSVEPIATEKRVIKENTGISGLVGTLLSNSVGYQLMKELKVPRLGNPCCAFP